MGKKSRRLLCLFLAAVLGGAAWKIYSAAQKPLQIGISVYLDTDTFVEKIISGMEEAANAYEQETGQSVRPCHKSPRERRWLS